MKQVETIMAVPPEKIFAFRGNRANPQEIISNQKHTGYILDPERPIEYPEEGGILAYHIGVPYPEKGFPDDYATYALNGLKRMTIGPLRALMTKDNWRQGLAFFLTPKKAKIRAIGRFMQAYSEGAMWWVGPHVWDVKYMSTFGREFYAFLMNVCVAYGISPTICTLFCHIIAYMVDYDNSYRLRVQDLFSETTKAKLMGNLRGEIKRLFLLYQQRQPNGVGGAMHDKFRAVATMLSFLTFVPGFKKAIITALEKSNFVNFQYDESDRYHILLREDYDHMGYTAAQREQQYVAIHRGKFPPRIAPGQRFVR